MNNINEHISKSIKRIRKEKGLTLDELAETSGVSKSMLSEIERGGTNPTILVLWKIAEGLKTPLTELMSKMDAEATLVRAVDQKVINQTPSYKISSIFPYHNLHKTEILNLKLEAHAEITNSGHKNIADEVIYVVQGSLNLALGSDTFCLGEGDAISFKGQQPHKLQNDQDDGCLLINVLYYA